MEKGKGREKPNHEITRKNRERTSNRMGDAGGPINMSERTRNRLGDTGGHM